MERKFHSVPLTAAVGHDDSVHVRSPPVRCTNFVKGRTILLHSLENPRGSLDDRSLPNILSLSVSNPETVILLRYELFTDAELRVQFSRSSSYSFKIYLIILTFQHPIIAITFFFSNISLNILYCGSLFNCSKESQLNLSHAQLIIKCLSGYKEM